MGILGILGLMVISYLIGSIPFGYVIARLQGVDIRSKGSGNIGATNVWRNLGFLAGLLVFIGDAGKGVLGAWLGRHFGGTDSVALLTSLAVVAGHGWPLFLGFKGGKIIATSLGVFLVLDKIIVLPALGLWIILSGTWRYISLASMAAAFSIPLLMLFLHRPWPYVCFSIFVFLVVVYKHYPNIKRLLAGTEPKINLFKPR